VEEPAVTERKGRVFDRNPSGNEQGLSGSPGTSTVVFYGDPQLVSDAFALALNVMDTSVDLLTASAVAAKPKTLDS
jgi:hypothetical protein